MNTPTNAAMRPSLFNAGTLVQAIIECPITVHTLGDPKGWILARARELDAAQPAQAGEAVGTPSHWAAIDDEGDIEASFNADDGSDGQVARAACNAWINEHGACLHLRPLYLHAKLIAMQHGDDMEEPYFVQVDESGCSKCGKDRSWTVVYSGGDAVGRSWNNEADADDFCEYMNTAYSNGRANPYLHPQPEQPASAVEAVGDTKAWLIERDAGAAGIEYLYEGQSNPRYPSLVNLCWTPNASNGKKFDTQIAAEAFKLLTGLAQPEYAEVLNGTRSAEHMWMRPCRNPQPEQPASAACVCPQFNCPAHTFQSPAVSPPSVVAVSEEASVAFDAWWRREMSYLSSADRAFAKTAWCAALESFAQRIAGSGERDVARLEAVNEMQRSALLRIMRRLGIVGAFNVEVADQFISALDRAEAIAQQDKRGGA